MAAQPPAMGSVGSLARITPFCLLTHSVAECEQLALDSHVAPARILLRHAHHQGGEGVVDRWPSGPIRVGPPSAYEAAMPAQDRVRGDQAMPTQRAGQPPDERGEHRAVCPVQAWSWVGAAQYGDLVAQHEELDVLGGGRAAHQQNQAEHLAEDQIKKPQGHGGDHPGALAGADHRWSAAGAGFWNPTGALVADRH